MDHQEHVDKYVYKTYESMDTLEITIIKKEGKMVNVKARYDVKCIEDGAPKGLLICPSYAKGDVASGVYTMGVTKGSKKYNSNRRCIPLNLDPEKKEERDFLTFLETITKALSNMFGRELKNPAKKNTYNGKDLYTIWSNVVESNDGRVYTMAYDAKKNIIPVNELDCNMLIRPALYMSITVMEDNRVSLRCNVSEFCVIRKIEKKIYGHMAPTE